MKNKKRNYNQVIGDTFQELSDLVTPTMGAKGRMAIIEQDMDRPLITDDGVTVARESRQIFKGTKRLPAISAIEAAATTESEAYDGTTLTILLINELYKLGYKWVRSGMHPQEAADQIEDGVRKIRTALSSCAVNAKDTDVYSIAKISTKIPLVGQLVSKAYETAGINMNIVTEHARDLDKHEVTHIDGMVLESGYFAEVMKSLCNKGTLTEFTDAHIALLSSDAMSYTDIVNFFNSIPAEHKKDPYVFVVTRRFNPESLQMLVQTLQTNEFKFQMIFINEEDDDDLFLDLAAKTKGLIQDSVLSTDEYRWEHCGSAAKITIEQNKTIIINEGEVAERVEVYQKQLTDEKYSLSRRREALLRRRLAALTTGVTKIRIAVPTITEFNILKLKLDDAIGAVKKSLTQGIVLGGGKTLYNLSSIEELKPFATVLKVPMETIVNNAGLRGRKEVKRIAFDKLRAEEGIDVTTGKIVNLYDAGIIDSFASINSALKNASSIASSYLRGYTTILKYEGER